MRLGLALASAGAARGAALVGAFALGTLPSLLAVGAVARWLAGRVRAPRARRAAGVALAGLGLAPAGVVLAPAGLVPLGLAPACCERPAE